MLWTAGLMQIRIANLLNLDRPSVPGLSLNILICIALGLVKLGQIQFKCLSQGWWKKGLTISPALVGRRVRYA